MTRIDYHQIMIRIISPDDQKDVHQMTRIDYHQMLAASFLADAITPLDALPTYIALFARCYVLSRVWTLDSGNH